MRDALIFFAGFAAGGFFGTFVLLWVMWRGVQWLAKFGKQIRERKPRVWEHPTEEQQ